MLRKHTDIEIDPSAPFANDCLGRKPRVETLTRLVQSTTQPFVLSVEAPWGRGKTTFLRMWKAHLESEGHLCLHFNAWENDFVDDPLTAFVGEMDAALTEVLGKMEGDAAVQKHWKTIRRLGGGVLRKTLPLAVQIATQGLLSQQAVKDAVGSFAEGSGEVAKYAAEAAEKQLASYEAEKRGIAAFRSNLAALAEEIQKQEGRKGPVVFFIDELDRCRPDFAIALLERVKHLFSVEGIVFVLGIDRKQLVHSVRSLYGASMDANGYLRRFIDLAYTLPQPDTRTFCQALYNRFDLPQFFQRPPRQSRYGDDLLDCFQQLTELSDLSLREIEQCFTELNLAVRTTPERVSPHPLLLALLVVVKTSNAELYADLAAGKATLNQLLSYVRPLDNYQYDALIEAAFMCDFMSERDVDRKLNGLDKLAASGYELENKRARRIFDSVFLFRKIENSKPIRRTIARLAISSDFE